MEEKENEQPVRNALLVPVLIVVVAIVLVLLLKLILK